MPTVAEMNNNPGNIRPPKGMTYKGQIGIDDRGFAIFQNYADGRNALIHDIQVKQKNGINTPHSFIDKYTPAGEENKEESRDNYKLGMASHLGLKSTNDPFPAGSAEKIADFIESFESGKGLPTQEAPKANPNDPFAQGVPLADKAREASKSQSAKDANAPQPEEVIDPLTGLLAGAGASALGQIPFEPQMPAKAPDLSKLESDVNKAQTRADIAQQRLLQRTTNPTPIQGGSDLATLEADYKRTQKFLKYAEEDLQNAINAQKARMPSTPAPATPSAPQAVSAPPVTPPEAPQIITDPNQPSMDQHTRAIQGTTVDDVTGRARQTTYNERTSQIARNAANQQQVLQVLGEQGVVDPKKALALTEGISGSTPSGVMVSPDLAGEKQLEQELQQKLLADQAAQERLAQQQRMQALKNERDLLAREHSEAKRLFEQAQKTQTAGVTRAQIAAETAADRAAAAQADLAAGRNLAKAAPSGLTRAAEVTGVKAGKAGISGRAVMGGLGGFQAASGINELANIPIADLIKRYQAGERSPELIAAIQQAAGATAQTGFGAAATVPVIGPKTARIKGIGTLGTLGLGAYQGYKALSE